MLLYTHTHKIITYGSDCDWVIEGAKKKGIDSSFESYRVIEELLLMSERVITKSQDLMHRIGTLPAIKHRTVSDISNKGS